MATAHKYETVIPCKPLDLNKLPFVIRSLFNATDTDRVHVITPDVSAVPDLGDMAGLVSLYSDKSVLDIDPEKTFKYRPFWVYQQFLKLFQNVTSTDWFLVIDADLMFNKRVSLFESGKPVFLLGHDQCIDGYFVFNKKMINIGKIYGHSFLSECTLYSKSKIQEMLSDSGYSSASRFIEKAAKVINDSCFPAESELYGSYIYATQPDLYIFKKLKAVLNGKYGDSMWTDDEIRAKIKEMSAQEADIFTIHTWEGAV